MQHQIADALWLEALKFLSPEDLEEAECVSLHLYKVVEAARQGGIVARHLIDTIELRTSQYDQAIAYPKATSWLRWDDARCFAACKESFLVG